MIRPSVLLTLCLSLLLACPALAASITPVGQDRYFREIWFDGEVPDTVVEAQDFAPFVVTNRHDSSIGATLLQADLAASGKAPDIFSQANQTSQYLVDFDLDDDAPYQLSGEIFNYTNVSAGADGGGFVRLQSYDDMTMLFSDLVIYHAVGDNDAPYESFDTSGILPAGRYRMWARAIGEGVDHSVNGPSTGSGSLNFEFSIVPEPGAAVLGGIGLLMLAFWRRR